MNKVSSYIKNSYDELMNKVTWPSWSELQQSTSIVLVATLLITLLIWLMDFSASWLLKLIYSLFR